MADTKTTPPAKNAYVTLLTRPSYLAGAILLAFTLTKHSPDTPLIITYTPDTLPASSVQAFRDEAKHSNIILHAVSHLRLPDDGTTHGMVAERFIDTWTKLRVFDLWALGYETLCWLDADMLIFRNPSALLFNEGNEAYLRGGDGMRVMAVHTCVCNLDDDSWAPESWRRENCALGKIAGPAQRAKVESAGPDTLRNFNSGTFVYRPSRGLAGFVRDRFREAGHAKLRAMRFPDQDFLNEAFEGRWESLSWRVNALKTWRYWHTNIWKDEQVAVLHYIVDKPWAARVKPDGTAGYLGKDGATHGWWWDEYAKWEAERKEQGEHALLDVVGMYAARKDGNGVVSEEMRAIGGGAQDYAKKWGGKKVENRAEERREGGGEDDVSDPEEGVNICKP